MTMQANPDIAHICPACNGGTGIAREDGPIVCAKCSHEWQPLWQPGDEKTTVKVAFGDGIYVEYYAGNDRWGPYIDTDRWLECVGDFDDPLAKSLQLLYDAIAKREDFKHSYDYEIVEAFFDSELTNVRLRDGRDGSPSWHNTYNYDCDLDTTLEMLTFEAWTAEDDPDSAELYIMFRRHMGGDVRGNYASPVIARLYEDGEQYDVRIRVDVGAHPDPMSDGQLSLLGDRPPIREWIDLDDTYAFDRWLETQDVTFDEEAARVGLPRLSDGRPVYFASYPIMSG